MYSLFIDTHFRNIYLGLFFNSKLIDTIFVIDAKSTSELTMDLINSILEKNNCSINKLSRIIVCNGPGSFTGVRIGVTVAKMLAYLLNIPIYTINSIELVALSEGYKDAYYGVKENNGIYIGKFINGRLNGDIIYKKNLELESISYDICIEKNIKVDNLLVNIEKLHIENCFDVNPIYVKSISAFNNNSAIGNKGENL